MENKRKAYLQLHFVVLLYGLTAILGDLISISAFSLVWWRVLITSMSLLILLKMGKSLLSIPRGDLLKFAGIGVIIALHWVTFYGAIKLANASVALAAFASTSLFTSILEPIMTSKPFDKTELIIGILVIPAMLLIANNIDVTLLSGLWVGLFSAFLAAVFSILNKKMVNKATSYQISFIEMFSAFCFLSLLLPYMLGQGTQLMPIATDWIYLIILSLLCTTLAFILNLKALEHVSAFDANLVINLEPVYGILMAIFILKEHKELTPQFYVGVSIIILLVISHPIIKKLKSNV